METPAVITDIRQAFIQAQNVTFSNGMYTPRTPIESVSLAVRPAWEGVGWELAARFKFKDKNALLDVRFKSLIDRMEFSNSQPITLGALMDVETSQNALHMAVARVLAGEAEINIKIQDGKVRFELTIGLFETYADLPSFLLTTIFNIP